MRNKGFTIMELLISLPLFGMIIILIFSVTSSNMRTINNLDKDVELQQQAQFIFGFMEEKIIESTGVIYLEDMKGFQKHNTKDKVYLKKIIFKNLPVGRDYPHRKDKGYIFLLSKDPECNYFNLKYGVGVMGGASDEVGNYIESMEAEPIPADKNFNEADGIFLRIYFLLDGYASSFESSFYYRNAGGRV